MHVNECHKKTFEDGRNFEKTVLPNSRIKRKLAIERVKKLFQLKTTALIFGDVLTHQW